MIIKSESNIDIESYLIKQKQIIDNFIKNLFSKNNEFNYPKDLWEAVQYSLLNGGKRIRSILCLETFKSLTSHNPGLNSFTEDCLICCSSIELIHAMSLIHDDLPCMDNDDFRRGKPSCHKAFEESTAILAGDAMLSLAFYLISEKTKIITDKQKIELINILSKAFTFGLVPGQILDIASEGKIPDFKAIEKISTLKTAELIKASVLCGTIIACENTSVFVNIRKDKLIEDLNLFGTKIGIAFQIIDDILDITGDTKTLGKTSGKDEKQKKLTYPLLNGIESSKTMANLLISEAKSILKNLPLDSNTLISLTDYIVTRIN